MSDHVVLLDARGRPSGTAPKATVHSGSTPLHLAFSCHVVDRSGRVLLARRAAHKRTWPSTWSNACCGHPQEDETLRHAVERRLRYELGLRPVRMRLALPDFAYRAAMEDGTVEHELCPVVVAEVCGEVTPNVDEVDAVEWTTWDALTQRAATSPETLSPWAVAQVNRLGTGAPTLAGWLEDRVGAPSLDRRAGECRTAARSGRDLAAVLDPTDGAVERCLTGFIRDRTDRLRLLDEDATAMAGVVAGLVRRGGKRLRPSFVHWGSVAAGGNGGARVVAAAAAIEMLHTFALVHDDVIDRSSTRRGGPTAHLELARHGPGAKASPESQWFGMSAAILAGDLAFVWADELFDGAARGGDDRPRKLFDLLRTEVIAGQYLDLRVAADASPDEDRTRKVALLKTARYSVTRPVQLGAALATVDTGPDTGPDSGCDTAVHHALQRYGDAVGVAFQLRDDVLGLYGDPAETGKSRLDDLREGKRTLLVTRALALGNERQHRAIRSSLGRADLDESDAERCRDAVAGSGALASVEALIAAQHDASSEAVAALPDPAREALSTLADFAAYRCR
ncbi:MAG: isopentenyl-diphosphate Delta-isomerase [Actinobacteria bacterium]|nr:isopentenyl-diphosphate Delta-isomerase [Actinomycetota bacterium]